MNEKKPFFRRPSEAEIRKGREKVLLEKRIIAGLQQLEENQYAVIKKSLLDGIGNPNKFLKQRPTIDLRGFYSVGEAVNSGKAPYELFREAVETFPFKEQHYVSGFTFRPVLGDDNRRRRVPLIEILEAARILAYGEETSKRFWSADVTVDAAYSPSREASRDGGSFIVSTPSRRRRHPRYRFIVNSIPVDGSSPFSHVNPYSFSSEMLGVESKAYRLLRFTYENHPGHFYYVQAHEIAAYYAIAEKWLQNGNSTVFENMVFPVPSQNAVDLYRKLNERTLLQVKEGNKLLERHLQQGYIEAALWGLVFRQGFDAVFDKLALADGRLRNYQWKG